MVDTAKRDRLLAGIDQPRVFEELYALYVRHVARLAEATAAAVRAALGAGGQRLATRAGKRQQAVQTPAELKASLVAMSAGEQVEFVTMLLDERYGR